MKSWKQVYKGSTIPDNGAKNVESKLVSYKIGRKPHNLEEWLDE